MRSKLIESNKPEHYIHSVRNADTSAAAQTIPTGTPLVLNVTATPQPSTYSNGLPAGWEDGLQVVLPSTAGASSDTLFNYGVAVAPIVYPQLGASMVHGVCQGLVNRGTRSATTANWGASASASGWGDALTINTANNAYDTLAISNTIHGYSPAPALLLDNFASVASSASNSTDTRTVIQQLMRCFVRQM